MVKGNTEPLHEWAECGVIADHRPNARRQVTLLVP